MTTIFDHLAYVTVSWSNGSKIFDWVAKISKLPWSNGQNWPFLTMNISKISKLLWSNGQNRLILTIDHGQNRGSGVMVMVNSQLF